MRKGFTFIELFIVVGIIVAFSCIMVPVFQTMRRAATATACANNLHQVGLAYIAYASDWQGRYPAISNLSKSTLDGWFLRIPDYLEVLKAQNIMRCAGQPITLSGQNVSVFTNACPKSFKMNHFIGADGRPRYLIASRMVDAPDVLMLVDGVCTDTGMGQWGTAYASGVTDDRHRGYVNGLACDAATLLRSPAPADWNKVFRWLSLGW